MLLQIECLKFVAFPQLFISLLILKRLIVSKQEHVISWELLLLQSPGQGGTQLLLTSTCRLVISKKRETFFILA